MAPLRLAVEGVQALPATPTDAWSTSFVEAMSCRRHLTMEARLIEWAGLFFPMTVVVDRAAYVRTVASSETPEFAELAWTSKCHRTANGVPRVGGHAGANAVLTMEHALRSSRTHLPVSLVGPLWRLACAWRLTAGSPCSVRDGTNHSGRRRRSSALKTGAPSPKHGHIFMHPWISVPSMGSRENRSNVGRKNRHCCQSRRLEGEVRKRWQR